MSDQPLSDQEFDQLDRFLLSDRCGDDVMTMDALHGYLTALTIGPEAVPREEWLPRVWGNDPEDAPRFQSPQEEAKITGLIERFAAEIALTFEVAPKDFEPLFCEHQWQGKPVLDGEAWAWGFWEGMQLRAEAWRPIEESPLSSLLRPFYLLGAEEIEEEEVALVDDPLKCHKLTLEIEAAIPHIWKFWLPHRAGSQNLNPP
jgi:uncharacterized protein